MKNKWFEVRYKAVTYDNDRREEIILRISFSEEPVCRRFPRQFYLWCKKQGIIRFVNDTEECVGFRKLNSSEFDPEAKTPPDFLNREELHYYDTGYIHLKEPKLIYITHEEMEI